MITKEFWKVAKQFNPAFGSLVSKIGYAKLGAAIEDGEIPEYFIYDGYEVPVMYFHDLPERKLKMPEEERSKDVVSRSPYLEIERRHRSFLCDLFAEGPKAVIAASKKGEDTLKRLAEAYRINGGRRGEAEGRVSHRAKFSQSSNGRSGNL